MAVEIDTPHLASYLSIPEAIVNDTLLQPTSDHVAALLRSVLQKATEHEEAEANRLKLEVELENAIRAAELKTKTLKASVDTGAKQVRELREQLNAQESSSVGLQSELQALRASTSASETEAEKLRARISSLESSNRDTLSLLESKNIAYNEVSNDLVAKQQKVNELRGEVSRLEQDAQAANSTSVAARVREQNMQHEVDSLRRNNEWLDSELKNKSAEHAKFRKEKNAQLAERQQQNEDDAAQIDSLKRSEAGLRIRVDEMTQKADAFLVQMKELREEATQAEENLRAELDTAKRLEALMDNSMKTAKQRQQDLSAQLDQTKDSAAEEIGRLSAEIETEHQERLSAERRIAELENKIEQLGNNSELISQHLLDQSAENHSPGSTSALDATPSKSRYLTSLDKIGNINVTQMVADYHAARSELEAERKRSAQLRATIDEMIRDIEARQPEILEMQADHSRMEADLVEMSNYADHMSKEREEAKKATKKLERQLHGVEREGDILRQQLRDLSSQIKVLLMELNSQSSGLEPFTAEQRAQLEQLVRGDLQSELSQEVTDTSLFISQHLTAFRDINELVDQNSKLLRVAREVGEKMEGEEAQAERTQAAQNLRELEELRRKYESSRDEVSSLVTQSESYIKERDMFRRMLSHRGQLPAGADLAATFGESLMTQTPATPVAVSNGLRQSLNQSPNSKDLDDYRKLLKEMQAHFDSYRQEAAADRSSLKDQLDSVTLKNTELRNELSKRTGEVTLTSERYEMLQGNFNMMKSENAELQKRAQTNSERATKQDIRAQQIVEELVEAKGFVESMRNENANLKAEKEFWKAVESRLTSDNEGLLNDRHRLNTLNANLQNLLNEREHAEADIRRRLQAQLESLENETQTLKRRLDEEQEEHKRSTMRRDYETSQYQSRLEDLTSSLASVREDLVAARTTKDYLQNRVEELQIEIRSAEEKLDVLQSKPSDVGHVLGAEGPHDLENTEQGLKLKIAELKKETELTQSELSAARLQIEQYKSISQCSEDELRSFNETHEQYRQEMDATIAKKDERIKEFEHNMQTLREELSKRDAELNEVRTAIVQHDMKIDEQKHAFEAEIIKLKDAFDRAETTAQYHQEDLRMQAEIAQQAQQNYESELLKHAEAAKAVQKIRAEYNGLKLEYSGMRTTAEAAETKLHQNEESWTEAKQRYESELAEIRSRREDTSSQNRILHEQLESVYQQVAELQKQRHSAESNDAEAMASHHTDAENLHELVRFLRREKEIVDVQYDLATQEARRLRQQLEHTQTQLEDTRMKLGQHRQNEEHNERNVLNHKKLIDTIEELNLHRESNSALRAEKNQLQSLLNEKLSRIEELQNQISPLQANISELEGKGELLEQDLRLAQEARARFEQRYLDILNRSNSIDPAEFERITQTAASLESEKSEWLARQADLQAQLDSVPDQIKQSVDEANKAFQETRAKIVEQSKNRDRSQVAKLKEKDAALQEALQSKLSLETQIAEIETQLDHAKKEHQDALESVRAQAQAEGQTSRTMANQQSDTAKDSEGNNIEQITGDDSAQAANNHSAAEVNVLRSQLEAAELKLNEAQSRIQSYESQIATLRNEIEQANSQLASQKAASSVSTPRGPVNLSNSESAEEVARLRQELSQAQEEMEMHRAALLSHESAQKIQTGEDLPSIEEQIKSQVEEIRIELSRRHDERLRQLEETYKTRTENMRSQLSKRLAEGKADISRKLQAGHNEAVSQIQEQHAQQVQELHDRHKRELAELQIISEKPASTSQDLRETSSISAQTEEIHTQLTESEIRAMLQKNEIAKRFVMNSLTNRENKVRDEQQKLWSQKMGDAETKAKQALDQAVTMEGKRMVVKVNMAENRAKAANAKLEVVKQAAADSPEKSVSEVWASAQNAKPAPAAQSTGLRQSVHAAPAISTQQSTPATSSASKLVLDTGIPTQTTSAAGVASQGRTESLSDAPRPASQTSTPSKAITTGISGSAHAPASKAAATPSNASATGVQQDSKPATDVEPPDDSKAAPAPNANGSKAQSQSQSGPSTQGTRSNIPQPSGGRSASGRGGANAGRGRGRGGSSGIGRGGPPTLNTNAAQGVDPSGTTSSSPRNLSATAKQFVPRKRDATGAGLEGSSHAGEGKRAKPAGSG